MSITKNNNLVQNQNQFSFQSVCMLLFLKIRLKTSNNWHQSFYSYYKYYYSYQFLNHCSRLVANIQNLNKLHKRQTMTIDYYHHYPKHINLAPFLVRCELLSRIQSNLFCSSNSRKNAFIHLKWRLNLKQIIKGV